MAMHHDEVGQDTPNKVVSVAAAGDGVATTDHGGAADASDALAAAAAARVATGRVRASATTTLAPLPADPRLPPMVDLPRRSSHRSR
jgi:hypothetical protein